MGLEKRKLSWKPHKSHHHEPLLYLCVRVEFGFSLGECAYILFTHAFFNNDMNQAEQEDEEEAKDQPGKQQLLGHHLTL